MSLFSKYLLERKRKKGYLFVPYIAIGDPDFVTSERLVDIFIENGADSIELGLPFTDPAADGVVLQRAFQRILGDNFSMNKFNNFLEKIHKKYPEFPLTVMGYSNIFYQAGFSRYFKYLFKHGVRAIILPDVPFEEQQYIREDEQLYKIMNTIPDWINFITPTTTPDRMHKICSHSDGFIYLVSYKGVTGQTDFTLKPLERVIRSIRNQTNTPILAGFGIRNKTHTLEAKIKVDGFIVGTRFHEIIEQNMKDTSKIAYLISAEIQSILPNEN